MTVRLLVGTALLAGCSLAQNMPVTKGAVTVQVVRIQPASLAPWAPIVPTDLGVQLTQVFVSTANAGTAKFRVSITTQDGDATVTLTQEVERSAYGMSLALFRLPLTARVVGPVVVEEIAAAVEFDWFWKGVN
jgi:hypothetical protein